MTPFEKIQLIEKITFDSLDKKAKYKGFKSWNQMKKDLMIVRWQSEFIEESIRLALNKFDSEVSSNQKEKEQ